MEMRKGNEMRTKTIAVDFDGTLCRCAYPGIGVPLEATIKRLKAEKAAGAKIILWTCRNGALLDDAVAWCAEKGIVLDAVNENLPENIAEHGRDTRKIAADEYWDDRAVRIAESPLADDVLNLAGLSKKGPRASERTREADKDRTEDILLPRKKNGSLGLLG
jgi:hypothetical protein